jgi:uncharacterized OB-fold protein
MEQMHCQWCGTVNVPKRKDMAKCPKCGDKMPAEHQVTDWTQKYTPNDSNERRR